MNLVSGIRAASASACRWCKRPLSALERINGGVCGRLSCRHRSGRESALAARDAELAARRARAARRWQDERVTQARVVWIERHATRLVPLQRADRERQRAHLAGLAAQLAGEPAPPPAPAPAPEPEDTPLARPLCGFCAGRCCRYGAGANAFVSAELLRRWLARHPGRSSEDAAAHYLARLPRHHVEHSCLHHGRDGCTLAREDRSDICNHYACDGLRSVQEDAITGHPPLRLAAMTRADDLGDAALLEPAGWRRLPRR